MKKQNKISVKKYCKELFTKKRGFTLAEVLIVITIIGVVTAMVLPTLLANVEEKVNTEKQVNIVQKVTQAMEVMKSSGELYDFSSTEEFVEGLKKHLKIIKVCKSDEIAQCWPTETVRNADNEIYEVKNAKTRNNLGFLDSKTVENVGIVLADGASLIMTYNPLFPPKSQYELSNPITKPLPVGGGKTKDLAYTTDVTSGIAFVMDVNGAGAPNKETINGKYNDIRSFNGAHFGTPDEVTGCSSGEKVGKYCVEIIDSYIALSCTADSPFLEYCDPNQMITTNNKWAGANYACKQKGMDLPASVTIMQELYLADWKGKPSAGTYFTKQRSTVNYRMTGFNFGDGSSQAPTIDGGWGAMCIGTYK